MLAKHIIIHSPVLFCFHSFVTCLSAFLPVTTNRSLGPQSSAFRSPAAAAFAAVVDLQVGAWAAGVVLVLVLVPWLPVLVAVPSPPARCSRRRCPRARPQTAVAPPLPGLWVVVVGQEAQ